MYARASLKWYGVVRAASVARTMERKFGKKGDLKGVRAWRLVAEELVRLELSGATPSERRSHPVAENVRRAS
jgi:hypothetical protein